MLWLNRGFQSHTRKRTLASKILVNGKYLDLKEMSAALSVLLQHKEKIFRSISQLLVFYKEQRQQEHIQCK